MNYKTKKGCNDLIITATLQGQRLVKVKLCSLSQAQLNELGERFNYPNVEPAETTATDEPQKRKKKPAKPAEPTTEESAN